MTTRTWAIAALISSVPFSTSAQSAGARPPVIDVHLHAPMSSGPVEEFAASLQSRLDSMDSLNVRFAVLNGVPDVLFAWTPEVERRIGVLPSLLFPCVNGLAVMWGRPCFENGEDWPDLDRLRGDIESGRVKALGEIATQFLGLTPSDPALEPYLALAEEYDLPVFIHMGPGVPGTNYGGGIGDLAVPDYRATAGNPLLLEEALLRHPGLRVAVMHAGWPLADEMVFMLHQHPQVYAEVGLLQYTELFPRAEYHSFLRRLVQAGFGDRILFGSDGRLSEGIDAIIEADFLNEQQKKDILCNNAARFLRLDEDVCK
ncbi:MAG: amidohydrolase family protein [Gemmatimonadota bacterium]